MQFNHLPQRLHLIVLRVQVHKTGMPAIADVDVCDCRGTVPQGSPNADTSQLLAGSLRQSDSPCIKAWMRTIVRPSGLHQIDGHLALRQ
ncbi:hypothetical protein D3C75_1131460 [compost metagenome]